MSELVTSVQTWSMVLTAVATIGLGFFTWVLARETKRLSRATAQAHVVAALENNQWAFQHADLVVSNTGNATAHDIEVTFEPPLDWYRPSKPGAQPLRNLSILKPGQSQSSHVGEFSKLADKTYRITTSWKHHPSERTRQSLSYDLPMQDYDGIAQLGARTPLIQIAEQLKKIREDWQWVAGGSRKLSVDSYSGEDREKERKRREAQRKAASQPHRKPKGESGNR
ncbi:MAG: hypothetical protein E5Y51_21505 [Mesorhizobium sp.]|uniref:hypothetical protein n=1 Tax=Mesorhizobium sp. M1A.F.Ca.IN.022.06.1.1 TaxID=2493680 RepID=UPI000F756CB5|nr:hypothetical protein [Mesorhizobium sp. M1A.F.Ca.IN.022.06.1.1]AZO61238.1 hypothetical protein EJ078_19755 [Mesorhizobium sp. M1A.F.Ca.IN.022.06.1.1]TIN14671.1 MAG: hypothetical protein E5Y51_21505 [Mesorhizobium sp.]